MLNIRLKRREAADIENRDAEMPIGESAVFPLSEKRAIELLMNRPMRYPKSTVHVPVRAPKKPSGSKPEGCEKFA
jgi:hypothetical protein